MVNVLNQFQPNPINLLPEPPSMALAPQKICIVTGSNTGIGKETARKMAGYGYSVVVACRTASKGESAASTIDGAEFIAPLDLSSFSSVRNFVKEFKAKYERLDVLVNNAGMNSFDGGSESVDGLDLCFQTNFLGHFLLTRLLLPLMEKTEAPRVVNLSSVMHHFGSNLKTAEDWKLGMKVGCANAYSDSKLASILFSMELNRRCPKLKSFAVNPGAVNSDIWRVMKERNPFLFKHVISPIFRTIYLDTDEGSVTTVAAAIIEDLDPATSLYLQPYASPEKSKTCHPLGEMMGVFVGFSATKARLPGGDGEESGRGLWDASTELCGL